MPDDYRRPIEPLIAIVLGWMRWKGAQIHELQRLMKCDGERRMIDEQRR
jgi:hypothetical protein